MAIDFAVDRGVALITINRPEVLNAMDAEHYDLLSKAWMQVRDDPAIRTAIITGAGERAFCAGADLRSYLSAPMPLGEMWLTQRELLQGPLDGGLRLTASQQQPGQVPDVLLHREHGIERDGLRREPDGAAGMQPTHVEPHRAARRSLHGASERSQERRLARAVGAEQPHGCSPLQVEGDIAEHGRPLGKGEGEPLRGEQGGSVRGPHGLTKTPRCFDRILKCWFFRKGDFVGHRRDDLLQIRSDIQRQRSASEMTRPYSSRRIC
ncbi:MAG: enoyl-CoA hydratase/isomerase family protein [Myxococcaceae bacterium]|nr:MAG: enoyl-CoA hydratase/isomerase family protein [Myxococcaceae bacterium]